MLTQEQKDLLEPLTHHERYGKLLIDAMETWETAKPKRWDFGLDCIDDKWQLNDNQHCCLLGACLVGKTKIQDSIFESVQNMFSISMNESWELSDGFDEKCACRSEANQFANKVSSIIFGS